MYHMPKSGESSVYASDPDPDRRASENQRLYVVSVKGACSLAIQRTFNYLTGWARRERSTTYMGRDSSKTHSQFRSKGKVLYQRGCTDVCNDRTTNDILVHGGGSLRFEGRKPLGLLAHCENSRDVALSGQEIAGTH